MDPAAEVRPPDPIVQNKTNEIEKKLANMKASDPWASAAANIGGKVNGRGPPNDHKHIMALTYVVGGFGREGSGEPELERLSVIS